MGFLFIYLHLYPNTHPLNTVSTGSIWFASTSKQKSERHTHASMNTCTCTEAHIPIDESQKGKEIVNVKTQLAGYLTINLHTRTTTSLFPALVFSFTGDYFTLKCPHRHCVIIASFTTIVCSFVWHYWNLH